MIISPSNVFRNILLSERCNQNSQFVTGINVLIFAILLREQIFGGEILLLF